MEIKLSNGKVIKDITKYETPKPGMLNDISIHDWEKTSIPPNNESDLVVHTGFIDSHLCIFTSERVMGKCDYAKDPFMIFDINTSIEKTREFLYFFGSPRMPYMDIIYKGAYIMFDFLKDIKKKLGNKVNQDINVLMDKISDALNVSDDS
jgi:hypothetical protein